MVLPRGAAGRRGGRGGARPRFDIGEQSTGFAPALQSPHRAAGAPTQPGRREAAEDESAKKRPGIAPDLFGAR